MRNKQECFSLHIETIQTIPVTSEPHLQPILRSDLQPDNMNDTPMN